MNIMVIKLNTYIKQTFKYKKAIFCEKKFPRKKYVFFLLLCSGYIFNAYVMYIIFTHNFSGWFAIPVPEI